MTTPPRDLTAEWAAKGIELARKIRDDIGMTYGGTDKDGIGLPWGDDWVGILAGYLVQTRQEALREAAQVVRDWPWEQPAVHADPLRQARCRGNREASVDIADALDRLASEGG